MVDGSGCKFVEVASATEIDYRVEDYFLFIQQNAKKNYKIETIFGIIGNESKC